MENMRKALTAAVLLVACGWVTMVFADVIVGTAGDDNLTGTIEADTISGRGGADTILGLGAGDEINGEGGVDTLYGNDGDDTINGGIAGDICYGGDDDDTMDGGGGDDTMFGDAGDDIMDGGSDDDTLYGGTGEDSLSGSVAGDVDVLVDSGTINAPDGAVDTLNTLDTDGNDVIHCGCEDNITADDNDWIIIPLTFSGTKAQFDQANPCP